MQKSFQNPAPAGLIHNYLIFFFFLLLIGSVQSAPAGDKIKIKLHQPPPNKLGAGNLWKLDITNTTKDNITIYLEGTVNEEKNGLIVEGSSKPFTVKPGKSTYGYNDFKSGKVSWKNKKYEEAIIRTGNALSGNYTICVSAYFDEGKIADKEQCITQFIENETAGTILLISPADGERVNVKNPLFFSWTTVNVKGPFIIKIVEVKKGQTPAEAITLNRALFTKKDIKTNSFTLSNIEFKLDTTRTYAWSVNLPGGVLSETMSFTLGIDSQSLTNFERYCHGTTDVIMEYAGDCTYRFIFSSYGNMQGDYNCFKVQSNGPIYEAKYEDGMCYRDTANAIGWGVRDGFHYGDSSATFYPNDSNYFNDRCWCFYYLVVQPGTLIEFHCYRVGIFSAPDLIKSFTVSCP